MSSTLLSGVNYFFPFQLNGSPLSLSSVGFALLAVIFCYGAFTLLKPDPYANIPAVGGSSLLSAYFTSKKFYNDCQELILTGYNQYKDKAFRIPDGDRRWNVIVTRPDQIEDVRKAPDDVLSFKDFVNETVFLRYLMGREIDDNAYHVNVVRNQLTRNLAHLFDDLRDEIAAAFHDNIPSTDDWTSVSAYSKIVQVVARATNRVFIGLPLCREQEFLNVNIDFTMSVNKGRDALILTPAFLRPLVARYLTTVQQSIATASKFLGPIIEERSKKIEEYGQEYPDKPVDLLSWFMDVATGDELSVKNLTNRFLGLNFAAIHTSSMSFTHALYHLAAEPHYLKPLREEIEAVIAEEGWTKVAMTKMHKLDSFFKESQRYNGISHTSMTRLALKDFTFSDGTFVPKGAFILAAAYPIHHDEQKYPDCEKFDGFRFAKIRSHGGLNTTNQFVNTSVDYIAFGHGTHACPGRFFAANELKAMMAHVILNYDVKMKNEGVRPPNVSVALTYAPDFAAEVMFRRRQLKTN